MGSSWRVRRAWSPARLFATALGGVVLVACSSADASEVADRAAELADRAGEVAADWAGLEPAPEVLGVQVDADATERAPAVFVFPAETDEPRPIAAVDADPEPDSAPAARGGFTSAEDRGRLFEIHRPGGVVHAREIAATNRGRRALVDGTVVLASADRTVAGRLWVEIADSHDSTQILGWVEAESLRPTNEVALHVDPTLAGYFYELTNMPADDVVAVRSGPNRFFDAVDHYRAGDLVLHGGTTALDGDGEWWMNIADAASKVELGWVNARFAEPMTAAIRVRNGDGTPALERRPGGWESGANIEPPMIVGVGCETIQVAITSASSHEELSSHVRFGTEPPTAPSKDWQDPQWDMGSESGTVYIRPGDSVVFTLPAPRIDEPLRYYFLQLDADDSAPTAFDFNGEAIRSEDGDLTAANVHEVRARGACTTSEPDPDTE